MNCPSYRRSEFDRNVLRPHHLAEPVHWEPARVARVRAVNARFEIALVFAARNLWMPFRVDSDAIQLIANDIHAFSVHFPRSQSCTAQRAVRTCLVRHSGGAMSRRRASGVAHSGESCREARAKTKSSATATFRDGSEFWCFLAEKVTAGYNENTPHSRRLT